MEWTAGGGAALVTVLAAVWWWLGRGRLRRMGRGRASAAPLSVAEVALLTNGPGRLAETVIVSMIECEQLRADSLGRLYRTPAEPADDLGREVAALVKHDISVSWLRAKLMLGDAIRTLVDDLAERGLLMDRDAVRRVWAQVALGEATLTAVAVALFVGTLDGFVLASALVAGWTAMAALSRRRTAAVRPTVSGRAAAEAAWRDDELRASAAGMVAVGGLASHPDRELSVALRRGLPASGKRAMLGGVSAAGGVAGFWAAGAGCGGGHHGGCGGSGCGSGCGGGSCGGGGGCGGGGST